MPEPLDLIWGAEAIAKALGVSTRRAYHMLEAGQLPARKVGALWCVRRADLERFFSANDAA